MQSVANFFTNLEHVGKIAGYIPGVSCATGAARIFVGGYQVFFGCVLAGLGGSTGAVAHGIGKAGFAAKCYDVGAFGMAQCLSGYLNLGRGAVEFVPVVGNIACWSYDKSKLLNPT